jgi:hypothetical protein
MRLMNSFPEIESKILEGALTLTNLAQAQKHFRNEAKHNKPLNETEKREVLKNLSAVFCQTSDILQQK